MKFEPHAYQKYCIDRVVHDDALALMLDMGLGKTVITLTAINDLRYNRFAVRRTLVIAPKKVAEATWSNEAAKWDHLRHLRVIPVLGGLTKRIRALCTPGDIWVINRENVQWLTEYYINAWPFDMVVCDEFSSFKNGQAKRTKALRRVRPHIQRMVGLTGTPAPNGLIDLWAQIQLLDEGKRLGRTLTAYRERYFSPDKRSAQQVFSYKPQEHAERQIWEALSDICVSMKAEDYLQLPDRTDHIIPVVLDAKAQKAYDQMEKDMLLELVDTQITAQTAAVLSGKLMQLGNGAIYDADRGVHVIHECKIEAFAELIESLQGKPALVFYAYQHDRDRIKAALAKKGLRVREMQSNADAQAWNAREVDVLLAHPASAAYGLNLQQGGNHVIWFGLTWSLELYQQANARLHRQGQDEKVIVHHLLVSGSMDEVVMSALQDKGDTQERLLQALKARLEKHSGAA